jgi:endo-1,4-beta-D-glucanase Y
MLRIFLLIVFFLLFACSDNSPNNSGNTSSDSSVSSGSNGGEQFGSHLALPSNSNPGEIASRYETWMRSYYVTYEEDFAAGVVDDFWVKEEAKGTARIKWYNGSKPAAERTNETVSEGIGYGMLLAALNGNDWERFDKLWNYSKANRISGSALMYWRVDSFTRQHAEGSASDAEVDILASLIIAYKKTGKQEYLDDAITIGTSIYNEELSGGKLLLPARNDDPLLGSGNILNISYISLAAIKMLSIYDKGNGRDWNAVLEANINYMQRVQNASGTTGLFPDWSNQDGTPVDPQNYSCDRGTLPSNRCGDIASNPTCSCYVFDKESVRIPLRLAWYYHWFGDDRAKVMLNKAYDYVSAQTDSNPDNIKSYYGYSSDLSVSGSSKRTWPSLCATGLASAEHSAWNEACNQKLLNNNVAGSANAYYAESLYMLYFMLFNKGFEL